MRYDTDRAVVTLSVTELCSMATVQGDLDLRYGKGRAFSPERARLGGELHRKLQSTQGTFYAPEVPLSLFTVHHEVAFEVSGRCDGVDHTDPLTVHEIKTVSGHSLDLPPHPAYVAQLKCYAYFLCRSHTLDRVRTRLTLCRIEDEKTKDIIKEYTQEELEEFYLSLLSRIEFRARFIKERTLVRLPSARDSHFPYAHVRAGQDIMLREVYRDVRAGKRAFIEAPTGTGKTISALYPAVRALGDGACDKIFYLTAKAAPRAEAYRAAERIFSAGAHLRTIVLTAREQLCKNAAAKADPAGISRHCNPYDCPYAKGFFDRNDHAVCHALSTHNGFPKAAIREIAEQFGICPYEFQLNLSEYCDIVICDYNYVFDPMVYLRRYFEPDAVDANRYVFLIDEAHNLADRACAMYSARLCNTALTELRDALGQPEEGEDSPLHMALDKLAITMYNLRRLCKDTLQKDDDGTERGYYISKNAMDSFHTLLKETRAIFERHLKKAPLAPEATAIEIFLSNIKRYLTVADYYDECFLTFCELENNIRTVRLICLDPSRILDACLARAKAAILFSATLTPPEYFSDILGGGKGAVRISLPSPFEQTNLCLVAVSSVSTRFEDRDKSYSKIASLIAATAVGKKGNYIVYFPSYDYLEKVQKAFCAKYPNVPLVVQSRSMRQTEKEDFLGAFQADGKLRIGFCVMGGSFSEGVDLPGKRLIGTVIVGSGLPGISNERNILKEYYDVTRERGFDYAYVYPGMNRVLQAAGRVIRREDDRGVVVLIDDRFATPALQQLFPDHWSHIQYARNPKELADITVNFWSEAQK